MKDRTPVSKAASYQEIGAFWDTHDATECGEQRAVDFDVTIQSHRRYYPLDSQLSIMIREIAESRGISEETLVNLWIQEKITETRLVK